MVGCTVPYLCILSPLTSLGPLGAGQRSSATIGTPRLDADMRCVPRLEPHTSRSRAENRLGENDSHLSRGSRPAMRCFLDVSTFGLERGSARAGRGWEDTLGEKVMGQMSCPVG